jgi:hypothetical protein
MATIRAVARKTKAFQAGSWLDLEITFASWLGTPPTQKAVFVPRDWYLHPVAKLAEIVKLKGQTHNSFAPR